MLSWPVALGALVVLLVAAACGRDSKPSPGMPRAGATREKQYISLFQIATESEDARSSLAARFADAHVDARIRAARDVPEDDVPRWMKGRDGWIVYVAGEHREKAEAVWDAWLDSRGLVHEERPAQSRPVLALGAERALEPKTVASIQAELQRRCRVDQDVRRDPKRHGQMQQVDADNTAWMKETAIEHGWIDVERFGRKAADAAFLLVQHSGDLALMNAALPRIERDVKTGRVNAENFALLFDRLQIIQGGQQRYGTQVMQDPKKGDWVVGRLEDPDRVDERRKEIGLGPLQDHLSRFGHGVRIER